jgi:hypothetical protein
MNVIAVNPPKEKLMKHFTIDAENTILVHADVATAEAVTGTETFGTAAELAALAANWPDGRLLATYNSLPVRSVKEFPNAATAAKAIWKVVSKLKPLDPVAPPAAKGKQKASQQAKTAKKAPTAQRGAKQAQPTKERKAKSTREKANAPRPGSKGAQVLEMIAKGQGATLAEIMKATKWQAHTVRGFISIASKKHGMKIESEKRADGERVYSVAR